MKTKILVVDDNADLLAITQLILRGEGYTVTTANDLHKAHALMVSFQPQLLLIDANICESEDGMKYCAELKEALEMQDVKLILMSGNEYKKEELTCADAFLPKPFDCTELTKIVASQLHEAEAMAF